MLRKFERIRFVASDAIGRKASSQNLRTSSSQVLRTRENPIFELPGVLTFALKTSFEASAHAQEVLKTFELKTKWRLPLSKKTPY